MSAVLVHTPSKGRVRYQGAKQWYLRTNGIGLRYLSPNGGENSGSGVFGVGAHIPRACGLPFGCASLRSEIVIRPPKSDPSTPQDERGNVTSGQTGKRRGRTSPQPISLQMNTRLGIADPLHQPNPLQHFGEFLQILGAQLRQQIPTAVGVVQRRHIGLAK